MPVPPTSGGRPGQNRGAPPQAASRELCKRPFPAGAYLSEQSDHARMSRVANALIALGWVKVTEQLRRAAAAKGAYLLNQKIGNLLLVNKGIQADIGPYQVRFGAVGQMTYEHNHSSARTLDVLIQAIDNCREDTEPFQKLVPG